MKYPLIILISGIVMTIGLYLSYAYIWAIFILFIGINGFIYGLIGDIKS